MKNISRLSFWSFFFGKLLFWFSGLAILLIILWQARISLATHTIIHFAENAGLKIVHLELDGFGFSETRIKSIQAEETLTSSRHFISLDRAILSYSISPGQGVVLNNITVDSIQLRPQNKLSPMASGDEQSAFIHHLLATMTAASEIPMSINSFEVKAFTYHAQNWADHASTQVIPSPIHLIAKQTKQSSIIRLMDEHTLAEIRVGPEGKTPERKRPEEIQIGRMSKKLTLSLVEADRSDIYDASVSKQARKPFLALQASPTEQSLDAILTMQLPRSNHWVANYSQDIGRLLSLFQTSTNNVITPEPISEQIVVELNSRLTNKYWKTVLKLPGIDFIYQDLSGSMTASTFHLELPDEVPSSKPYAITITPKTTFNLNHLTTLSSSITQFQLLPQGDISIFADTVALNLNQKSRLKMATLNVGNSTTSDQRTENTPTLSLADLSIIPRLSLKKNSDGAEIKLKQGFTIELASTEANLLRTSPGKITILKPTDLSFDTRNNWQLKNGRWRMGPFSVNHTGFKTTLNSRKITLNIKHISPQSADFRILVGTLGINTDAVYPEVQETPHPRQSSLNLHYLDYVNAQINIDSRGTSSWMSLQPMDLTNRIDLYARYIQRSGQIRYRITSKDEIGIEENTNGLNKWLELFNADAFKLTKGSINLKASGSWDEFNKHQFRIIGKLRDIDGQHNKMAFKGLNVEGDVSYPFTDEPDAIGAHLDQLETGITLSDVRSRIRLRPSALQQNDNPSENTFSDGIMLPKIEVEDLSGKVLGGDFSTLPFIYDPLGKRNEISLRASGLDIPEILELQSIEGLVVTGKLGGVLPIIIDKKGVHITRGYFENPEDEGGLIQYHIDSDNPGLADALSQTVIKALEEFHYSIMNAEVDYQPDGQLGINFHIEGKSPRLSTSRPVHFNVNSEQNVLSLLQSLQYANRLGNSVEQQFNDQH